MEGPLIQLTVLLRDCGTITQNLPAYTSVFTVRFDTELSKTVDTVFLGFENIAAF